MIIDLTHAFSDKIQVYPGDESPSLVKLKGFAKDGYNDYRLVTGMHSGTHIDGPMHLTSSAEYISSFPGESFIGRGCLLDVSGEKIIRWKSSYDETVLNSEIVLVNTGSGKYFGSGKYLEDNPVIDTGFAEELVKRKIKMLGIDLMSPDRFPFPVHKILLSNNIFIAENLANLDMLNGIGHFEVIALPLKINADSSPARIIARNIFQG
jgi:kynurenine formamidase